MELEDHHVGDASLDLVDQEQKRLDDLIQVKEERQEPVEEYVVSRFTPYLVVTKRSACEKITLGLCYRAQEEPVRKFNSRFQRRCYICNKKGHFARDCYAAKIMCYNCGRSGHNRSECSSPIMQASSVNNAAIQEKGVEGARGNLS